MSEAGLGSASSSASPAAASDTTPGASTAYGDNVVGPIERANLVAHLGLISQRLSEVERHLKAKPADAASSSKTWLEFAKVVLGGWPAFGLLFMFLFYSPIRDAINAIPEKVRSADEIGVMGVSLKNTIRVEAERVGAVQLSETLPALTPAAVEFLLRGSRDYNSLVSYSLDSSDPKLIAAIWLPSQQTIKILQELEAKKLVAIYLNINQEAPVSDLLQAIEDLKRSYPTRDAGSFSDPDRVRLELQKPTKLRPPNFNWKHTDLGKNAVSIIFKAVSAQLTPHSTRPETAKR